MPAESVPSTRTDRHPEFEHVALYHEGHDDLATRLAPDIARALEAGDAVLVCSPLEVWQRLTTQLGPASGAIEYVADDVRYEHPNVSMRILHEFVRDHTRDGARAWSIGAVPFNANQARNAEWVRYEMAVNEVLQHLPLRAVCTYDTAIIPQALLEAAQCAHGVNEGASAGRWPKDPRVAAAPISLPVDEPLLRLQVHSSRSARHTIAEAYRELVHQDALDDLTLIVSEVVSNALNYGEPPVTLSAWHDVADAFSIIDISDHGRGIDDPFVDLRPPRLRPGGAGMWIVGQLSDRVTSQRIDGVHHVTAIVPHRTQSTR